MLALDAAALRQVERLPFLLDGVEVGSVAAAHLPVLGACDELLDVQRTHVAWRGHGGDREAEFDALHHRLRDAGHIRGWRDERFAVVDPETLRVLTRIERAAARFWGTLTFSAHANGYLAGDDGRPVALWIAQRALDKPTDPGLFDNLVGGGVAAGQSPREALLREAWEEAGLQPAQLAGLREGSVLRLQRDIAEGLQHEWLYSFDILLPAGHLPQNQDGEVAGFTLMDMADALALAAGDTMTVDAALVTLDFALRHRLLDAPAAAARIEALRVAAPASR